MARYAVKDGTTVKVSDYDLTLMLSLSDVIPSDPALINTLLVRKSSAPKGKLRDFYNTKDNLGLVRKVFREALKIIITEISEGGGSFIVPSKGNTNPTMYIGELDDRAARGKLGNNQLTSIDISKAKFKVPLVKYKFSDNSTRQHLGVYINKKLYKKLIDRANTGKGYSKIPRKLNYFLPSIYALFPYIREDSIKRIIKHVFYRIQWHLRRGEEIRIIDREGEIRFFRPLGKYHDSVMKKVVKNRISRERKERYASIN